MPPVPLPLEGVVMPLGLPPPDGNRAGSMSLGVLIEFIVQRTYHELTVLADLLPRKTDMERKIEIYNYSARTRQLFVRLLALVKWANSASKVDKSAQIMGFLDKQSLLFVDTADMLARMARETLVHARLPNFHIPAAVEVLTTGSYTRLPVCIRDRIVPPDPITPSERRTTLDRLNRVIQHRLVTGRLLPQMRNLRIDAGRVTFTVDHEFQVALTVMGDGPNIPWRLLDIDILVDDKETGDGKALVHNLQVQYVHQVVQSRLVDCSSPLNQVYFTLHFFCQCLQLEVLYSQTLRLCRDRLDDLIQVDDYTPGKCLKVSYWKELAAKDPKSDVGYSLTVQVDADQARPLSVSHVPSLPGPEVELADRAIRSDLLSMERLLVHTIYIRTKRRLLELKEELETMLGDVECTVQGSPVILQVPILVPCLRAEHLLVTVETHTGMLQCHLPQYDPPILSELQAALNSDRTKLPAILSELRIGITMRRCEKTLEHLPATAHDRLPLLHPPDHPMTRIGRHRVYVRLHRHPNTILIVELKDDPPHQVDMQFYTAVVKQSSIEDNPEDDTIESDIPKMYLKVLTLVELDSFVLLHGPFTSIEEGTKVGSKRKADGTRSDVTEPATRKSKQPAYFIAELAHAVALCDERIPFVNLAQELTRRDIAHQGLQVEANATAFVLRVLQFPIPSPKISTQSWRSLLKRLLSVSIRAHGKGSGRCWVAELVLHGAPVVGTSPREVGLRRPVYCQYDMGGSDQPSKTVDALLADWAQIVHLYDLAYQLEEHITTNKNNLGQLLMIKSYTYSRLIVAYGPDKSATVTVQWCDERKAFTMLFGSIGTAKNAHGLLREQLEAHLNRHRDLPLVLHILNETFTPLLSISKLPTTPQMGVHNNRPQVPVQTFTLIPQSHTLIRLVYQGVYCLELRLKGNGLLTIRDGAYSRFDRSNVVEQLTPTQGLKGFLGKYVDESAALRRRSQCEDDDPPSPVAMETDGHGIGTGSFLNPRGPHSPAGLKFHAPMTPPSGSNPHTPASPHTSMSQPHSQTYGSPATSFNLASPPSLPPTINPSPNMLPHASPGGLLASSPGNPMHVPSPAGLLPIASPGPIPPGHSPAYLQGHLDGSPFPASHSPAASTWPGSPNVPRPSPARPGQSPSATHLNRVLPQRSWAGAVPTQVTHEALDALCTPAPHPQGLPGPDMSPLERFLGCVYMRRALQRFIHTEDCLTALPNTEPLAVLFKVETLQCRVGLNSQHLQSLHLKVTPLPEHKEQWSAEDLQLIERLFDTRAAAPPYKPNALSGFGRLLNVSLNVLRDFVQIIKLELIPHLIQQQGFKWAVQFCLRIPPSATPIVPVGQPGVISCRNKLLFFLQLTRVGVQYPAGMEPPTLVLPFVYDVTTNVTQLAEKREAGAAAGIAAASMQLKRFSEFGQHSGECSLFPALRDLLVNLTLPSEPSPMMSSPAHTGSVTPTMQPSPAMMHSPMSVPSVIPPQGPMSQQGGNVMGQQGPGSYPGMGMGQHMMGPN